MAKKRRSRVDDDDDGGEDLEDDLEDDIDDDGPADKGRGGKRKASRVDGDDDDDDEDEGGGGRKAGKKRNVFIDDIADVDDDEEEEEDDEGAEDLIDDRDVEIAAEEANAAAAGQANYRKLNREREEQSAEEIAKYIEERYQRMEENGYGYEEGAAGAVGQQAMQPTINDPKLWLIHCRPGHERELVTQLLQKYYSLHSKNTPLLIKSAVCLDHLKGYIYVEAEKDAHVRDAIRGLRNVFISKGVTLVPLDQMVQAITVNRKAKTGIARDNWVRVRNGLYKDDLAKVMEVDSASQKATIRLMPRLDLHAMANRAQDEEARKKNPFGRTGPVRPPAKPFNGEEARQLGLSLSRSTGQDGQTYIMLGSHRFVNGYVERDVAIKSLNIIEGVPPLEELQRYNACGAAAEEGARGGAGGSGTGDLSSLVAALPVGGAIPKTLFIKGDLVAIVKGELKGIEAIVDSTGDDGKVMVKPKVEGFNESVDFDNDDLRKIFRVGDHVRLVSGPYAGEIGIVLQVEPDNDQCIIISDGSKQEIKTFGRDMTCVDIVKTGVEVLGEYQLHDLVQLDQHTAGVIINIQRDSARVLTSASAPEAPDVRVVRAPDIQRKIKMTRNLMTTDQYNNQVQQGDYVTFSMGNSGSGSQQQQGANVEYVWRGQLFVKAREFTDTGGFVCVRANKCKVRGGKAVSNMDLARQVAVGGLAKASPAPGGARSSFAYMPASPSQYAGGGTAQPQPSPLPVSRGGFKPPPPRPFGGGGGGGGSYSGAANHAATVQQKPGRTVKVVGGQYNGYRGRVKHETGTHAQLELDAISGRIVTVEKRFLRDEAGGQYAQPRVGTTATGPPNRPGMGPPPQRGHGDAGYSGAAYGSRTPLHPSQTPLHPSMTPAHYSSHMTPGHAPYTPMHAPTPMDDNYYMLRDAQDDRAHPSAHTPGLGGNAYTPAAYTPASPSLYDQHHAPTPALDPGTVGPPPVAGTPGLAPTPALGTAATAPTPFLPAPTPAITPGDNLVGATPGLDGLTGATPNIAPTPHVGSAFTPHIAATPALPAETPGLPSSLAPDFSLWRELVVQLVLHDVDQSSWPLAVVRETSGEGMLHVKRGSFPVEGGDFVEDPGASEEGVSADNVVLVKPQKKDCVRVLYTETNQHVGSVGFVKGVMADTSECIVSLRNGEMCIAELKHVGKLAVQTETETA